MPAYQDHTQHEADKARRQIGQSNGYRFDENALILWLHAGSGADPLIAAKLLHGKIDNLVTIDYRFTIHACKHARLGEHFMHQELSSLGRIHFIGICGKGMSSLALALADHGVEITGSDNGQTYGNTAERLKQAGVTVWEGFNASHVDGADHVVMGRQYSRGNPEVEATLEQHLPYYSMPEFILHFFLRSCRNAVVAGTKGKTTTTAMLAWIMEQAGLNPGFMIGGILKDGMPSAKFPGKGVNVIEGDDYETLYWDHNPKFAYYRPDAVILTNIYADHPEFHHDEDGEIQHFNILISQLPANGLLLTGCANDLTRRAAAKAPCKVVHVGFDNDVADHENVIITDWRQESEISEFKCKDVKYNLPLTGKYNAVNAVLASLAAEKYGVPMDESAKHLARFHGVVGRQDILAVQDGIRIYSDLAYLPECLDMVRDSFRLRHPGSRLVLLYQPFIVNAMEGKDQELAEVMQYFDLVLLADVYKPQLGAPANPDFSEKLESYLKNKGTKVACTGGIESCHIDVLPHLRPGDTVLAIMHPKSFDCLSPLVEVLTQRS